MSKRAWRAYAVDAIAVFDDMADGQQVGQLTARIACDRSTPVSQFGREIHIMLSRPMLEILAQLAEDVQAVDYVRPLQAEE